MTDFNDRNQRFGDDDPSNQRNFLTGSEDHRKVAPPIAKDDEYFADKTTGQSSVNYGHPGADYVQQKVNYGQYGATHIHPDVNFVPPFCEKREKGGGTSHLLLRQIMEVRTSR